MSSGKNNKWNRLQKWLNGGGGDDSEDNELTVRQSTGAIIADVLKDTSDTAPTPYRRWTNDSPRSFLAAATKNGETLHPKLLNEAKKMRDEVHQLRMNQMNETVKDDELTTKEHVKRKEVERQLADNEMARKQANVETAALHDANAAAMYYMGQKYTKQLGGANNFIAEVQGLEEQMIEDF